MKYMIGNYMLLSVIGYNCTRKLLNCTLVQLLIHFLVQLYPNYTQKLVITYTNQMQISSILSQVCVEAESIGC